MPPKVSRLFGRLITASNRNKKRTNREDEDSSPPPPPRQVGRYTLPSPEPSSGASGGDLAGSSSRHLNDSESERDGDEEARQEENVEEEEEDDDDEDRQDVDDGRYDQYRPSTEELIPSYRSHVAFYYLIHGDRGVLKGYHRNHNLKMWKIRDDVQTAKLIDDSGLGHLVDSMFENLDMALASAFVERWHPETNSFHMPFGEMTILLHDSEFILGCKASGKVVSPTCEGDTKLILKEVGTVLGIRTANEVKEKIGWRSSNAKQLSMKDIAEQPRCPPSRRARIYLWWILTNTLFVDKTGTHGHVSFLELLREPEKANQYAWAAAALANMYRELGLASRKETIGIGGCLTLLQAWIYAYFPCLRPQQRMTWREGQPYAYKWIAPPMGKHDKPDDLLDQYRRRIDSLTADHVDWLPFGAHPGGRIPITLFRGVIHYRSIYEPYMPDRATRQLGYVQKIPRRVIEPRRVVRTGNPRQYILQIDPAFWVFEQNDCNIGHSLGSVATVGSEHTPDYMEWYLERTMPKMKRNEQWSSDEEQDDDPPIQLYEDPHQVLQSIAGYVAPYHRSIYQGSQEPPYDVLMNVADLTERMMPSLRIGRRNRSSR